VIKKAASVTGPLCFSAIGTTRFPVGNNPKDQGSEHSPDNANQRYLQTTITQNPILDVLHRQQAGNEDPWSEKNKGAQSQKSLNSTIIFSTTHNDLSQ